MHVEDVLAIAVQEPDALLISKKTKRPLRKVEQRADARVGLAVVVAERAFVIAAQLRYAVIGGECPVVAEGLIHFELYSLVFAFRVPVGVWLAVRMEFPAKFSLGIEYGDLLWISWADRLGRIKVRVRHQDRPRFQIRRIHRREASTSGRSSAASGGVEAIELVIGHEWRREAIGINTSRRQSRSIRRDGLARTKHD